MHTPPHSAFQNRVVLVVEDDRDIAEFLAYVLPEEIGCLVRTVPDARTALQVLAASPVDLIVLDLLLPDMHGFELFERLCAGDSTRDVPVLFTTAANSSSAFCDRGITEYLTKPFDLEVLLGRVERLLSEPSRAREVH